MPNNEHRDNEPKALSAVDADLVALRDFPLEDKMEFIADMFTTWGWHGVPRDSSIRTHRALFEASHRFLVASDNPALLDRSREMREDGISFSVLPDIPHPLSDSEDITTIRSIGKMHEKFYETEAGTLLIPVPQGQMVDVPANREAYYHMTMSTCSCIVGNGPEGMTVAHVSYSIESEVAAVLQHLQDKGIALDDIHVIASQTPGMSEAMGMSVVTGPEYYTDRGIPAANILSFTHIYGKEDEDIAEVTVAPDALRVAMMKLEYRSRKLPEPYQVDVLPLK